MSRPSPFELPHKVSFSAPAIPLFSAISTLLKTPPPQLIRSKRLAHSSENMGGMGLPVYSQFGTRLSEARSEIAGGGSSTGGNGESAALLVLLASRSQQAGRHGRHKRRAPQPRQAYVEFAKDRIQVNGRAKPIAHRIGMRSRGEIRREVVNAPRQHRPHTNDGEEKRQGEYEQHIAQRDHLRRARRPGNRRHATNCNQIVT